MNRVFGLDVLRSLAIAQVLLGHGLSIYLGQDAKSRFEGFYGFLGVELFFVLSGFLVGGLALQALEGAPTRGALREFLIRRWMRTLPNYYLFLAVNAGLAIWLGGLGFQPSYLVFLQNLFWPTSGFFAESWSLSVEELFYLALPLLLVLTGLATRDPRKVLGVLIGALAVFTAIRLTFVLRLHPDFYEGVRKTAGLRLDALMYGVVAAWLGRYAQGAFLRRRRLLLAWGVGLAILSVRGVVVSAHQSTLAASLSLCGVSLGVALTLPFLSTWRLGPGVVASVFEWLSRISYALYLCHLPTSRLLQHGGLPHGLLGLAVWLCVSCGLATAIHYGFERPLLKLRDRLTPHQRDAQAVPAQQAA